MENDTVEITIKNKIKKKKKKYGETAIMVFHVISSKLIILVLFYYISVFEFFVFTYYVFVSTKWMFFSRWNFLLVTDRY